MLRAATSTLILLAGLAQPALASDAAEHLAGAVRFPTISWSDRDKLDAAAFDGHRRYLEATYPRVFTKLDVEIVGDYSLLIRWPGKDAALPPILLTAHVDVVPIEPGTEEDWEHPPFSGVIADGMINGRGTLDDKVGVISLLEAAEALLSEGFVPERTVVFGFGHDEEVGGDEGAGAIAARLREDGVRFAFMVDEGGFISADHPVAKGRPVAMINVAEKGYLTLTLTARGEGGHSSMPPAHTAIGKLAAALTRLEEEPMPARLVSPVTEMFERLAPHASGTQRFALGNLWLTRRLVVGGLEDDRLTSPFVRTTTAITVVNGGVKDNVVPQRAEAKVNFRLLPGDTPDDVVEHVTKVIADPEIEIGRRPWADPPPMADIDGGGFHVLTRSVQEIYPEAVVVPSLVFGATDTRHYQDLTDDIYRFHGTLIEMSQGHSVHGTGERIGVESFEKTVEVAKQLIRLGSAREH